MQTLCKHDDAEYDRWVCLNLNEHSEFSVGEEQASQMRREHIPSPPPPVLLSLCEVLQNSVSAEAQLHLGQMLDSLSPP